MRHITYVEVSNTLKEVVRQAGEDHRYPRDRQCRYLDDDGHPACIVGRALHALGVGESVLMALDRFYGHSGVSIGSDRALNELKGAGFELDGRAQEALHTAQFLQDSGRTWGEVLRQVVLP